MSDEKLIYVNTGCPLCGKGGQLGFRLCDDSRTIVLMCDECDSIWADPRNVAIENILGVEAPKWQITGLSCGIGAGSRWAKHDEIDAAGYADLAAGEAEAL